MPSIKLDPLAYVLLLAVLGVQLYTSFVRDRGVDKLITANDEAYQQAVFGSDDNETVEVIEELLALARQMKASGSRGEKLKLSEDELAFYDALETNDSAVAVLGDAVLTQIARELTQAIRSSVTIDWTVKEDVRARLRVLVRRKLRAHGYPPDHAERAVETVLRQAELLAAQWAG